jgi:hypothetical protein
MSIRDPWSKGHGPGLHRLWGAPVTHRAWTGEAFLGCFSVWYSAEPIEGESPWTIVGYPRPGMGERVTHRPGEGGRSSPFRVDVTYRTRAGTPATTAPAGTSAVTTAPAPTTASAPTVTPPRTTAPDPRLAPSSIRVSSSSQSASV